MSNSVQGRGRARALLAYVLLGGLGALGLPTAAQAQQPFLGEVVCGGWNFCPVGWAECNGQALPISGNDALFQLIGTTYGGDGQSTFALPNLQGRTVIGQGSGPGLTTRDLGEQGGAENVTLSQSQIPSHTHPMTANGVAEKSASPTGKIAGTAPAGAAVYSSSTPNTTLHPGTVVVAGQSQPHNNLQPYLATKCCIAVAGVFPTPN